MELEAVADAKANAAPQHSFEQLCPQAEQPCNHHGFPAAAEASGPTDGHACCTEASCTQAKVQEDKGVAAVGDGGVLGSRELSIASASILTSSSSSQMHGANVKPSCSRSSSTSRTGSGSRRPSSGSSRTGIGSRAQPSSGSSRPGSGSSRPGSGSCRPESGSSQAHSCSRSGPSIASSSRTAAAASVPGQDSYQSQSSTSSQNEETQVPFEAAEFSGRVAVDSELEALLNKYNLVAEGVKGNVRQAYAALQQEHRGKLQGMGESQTPRGTGRNGGEKGQAVGQEKAAAGRSTCYKSPAAGAAAARQAAGRVADGARAGSRGCSGQERVCSRGGRTGSSSGVQLPGCGESSSSSNQISTAESDTGEVGLCNSAAAGESCLLGDL